MIVMRKPKIAFITGITGMMGSHLADLLLAKGYEVHGLIRQSSTINTRNITHILGKLHLHYGDLTDVSSLHRIIKEIVPDEIYNLAAQSHAHIAFENPEYTFMVNATGVVSLLEAMRSSVPQARFYQASSSEIFDYQVPAPWNEDTLLGPSNPYGVAKLAAHFAVKLYRRAYNLYVCNGIQFNNESPRRLETFLPRKVSKAVARIKLKKQEFVVLGNLEAKRDWGWAPEFAEVAWLILQQPQADDYVIATGESHSIKELVFEAFAVAGLNADLYIRQDPRYMRPAEVPEMKGDITKIKKHLGWEPKIKFKEIIKFMVEHDLQSPND